MRRIFRSVDLPTGERVEGIELSFEDHPGNDPLAPAQPAYFVRYVGKLGQVARMERHPDEAAADRWITQALQRAGG